MFRVADYPGVAALDGHPDAAPPLAILIPTFERAGELERLIRILAADTDIAARGIPVLVADNASADGTAEVLRALRTDLPELDLRLHVHASNLGFLANMRWLVEHAPPGEYLWILGDDDFPTDGTVEAVLEVIEEQSPALIHLPCRFVEDEIEVVASPVPDGLEMYFSSRELLLTDYFLPFVSATVVRRAALEEAVCLVTSDNEWAPHIWFAVAGRDDLCVVLPQLGVIGSPAHSWLPERVELLTRRVIDEYDDGLHRVIDATGFCQFLDLRYDPRWGNDTPWLHAPLEDLLSALERFPASRHLRRLLVERAVRDADPAAISAATRAARRSGAAAASAEASAEGEECFALGDTHRAVELLEHGVAIDPTNVRAWSNLGVARHGAGRDGVVDAFDHALALDPSNLEVLENRARWHAANGDHVAAKRDIDRMLALAAENRRSAHALSA
jgi:glycosyltransferase involved in cell wall biosynthesis